MVEYLYRTMTLYVNDKEVNTIYCDGYLSEQRKEKEVIPMTWENINDVFYKHGWWLPFSIWNFKRGKRIEFYNGYHSTIKQKKVKELNMKIVISESKPVKSYSIKDILEDGNAELAIKFLVERGVSVAI